MSKPGEGDAGLLNKLKVSEDRYLNIQKQNEENWTKFMDAE